MPGRIQTISGEVAECLVDDEEKVHLWISFRLKNNVLSPLLHRFESAIHLNTALSLDRFPFSTHRLL
ncbi:hypothetical protein D3C86_1258130 [compost metagenome]